MNMLMTALMALTLGTGPAQGVVDPIFVLRIATPTYGSNGETTGASMTSGRLALNETSTFYAYSGRNLCSSASARLERPSDAGHGWKVDVTPLAEADGKLRLQIAWQRQWSGGVAVTGKTMSLEASLGPGKRLMLDYLTGQPTEACDAIGMGLEVGLEAPPLGNDVVEAEVWLVKTDPITGAEESWKQTVRVRPGMRAPYIFDDLRLDLDGGLVVGVSGAVELQPRSTDRLAADLSIRRDYRWTATGQVGAAGGTYRLAVPQAPSSSEVVAYKLPNPGAQVTAGPDLSVRVRVRSIR